jgi:hypothetical protein
MPGFSRFKRACIATVAVALVVSGCERARPIAAQEGSSVIGGPHTGAFGYVDSSGTELLALDSLPSPSNVRGAICAGAAVQPVRYDRWQARRPEDNGRQNAYNFRNERGQIFRLGQGHATPNASCYLSPDSALVANARSVTRRTPDECAPASVARIAAVKKREVVHCWHIADASARLAVLAVQFVAIDSNALASLVVVGDSSLLFDDFPAVSNKVEGSTWRVDDGGVFSPGDIDVLFVAAMPYGFVMATAWGGAEGESCALLVANPGGVFRGLDKGYRYQAPM